MLVLIHNEKRAVVKYAPPKPQFTKAADYITIGFNAYGLRPARRATIPCRMAHAPSSPLPAWRQAPGWLMAAGSALW